MEKFLGSYSPYLYAILRIVAGLMFFLHGSQKLLGIPGNKPPALPPLIVAAGAIELVGGLMIALGLLGTFAAFVASGQMAFAYFIGHSPRGFWPTVNQGELAVLYCFLFLYFAAQGSGVWSVDSAIREARARSSAGP